MSTIDQQFVEFVVKSLVGHPDAVHIDRRIDEKGVLLELTVDPEDLGRVIGKHGATAQCIRTLLRALGTKNDARYNLKIVDNGTPGGNSSGANDQASSSSVQTDDDDTLAADSSAVPAADDHVDDDSTGDAASNERLRRTRQELKELDDLDV